MNGEMRLRGRILLVEDEVALTHSLVRILKREGFEVKECHDGQSALEALDHDAVDVLLTDIYLPDMLGTRLVETACSRAPYIACVVMSGNGTFETALESMHHGVIDYLVKPFDVSMLVRTLEKALAVTRLHREVAHLRELLASWEVWSQIAATRGSNEVAQQVADAMTRVCGSERVAIFTCGEDADALRVAVSRGHSESELASLSQEPAIASVYRHRCRLLYDGSTYVPACPGFPPPPSNLPVMWHPMVSGDRLVGIVRAELSQNVLNCLSNRGSVLDLLFGLAAQAMDVAWRQSRIEMAMEATRRLLYQTTGALAAALEQRDPYTAGHQARVTALACHIAHEMGLSETRIEGLRISGLLHDIGKIAVPAEILARPGRLSDAEMALIRTHPDVGHSILRSIEFPWPVASVVLQHHERLDGSGYPRGLTGEDITLEARIIAVADVIEAMSSHRPYRPALGLDEALRTIERGRGTLYDRDVADASKAIIAEPGIGALTISETPGSARKL